MMAILFAVKKWHYFLIGRHFVIQTDHQPLRYLMEQKVSTPSQHTWLAQLMSYDFEIVYKKGAENRAADALSRTPSQELTCMALSCIEPTLYQQILQTYEADESIQRILKELQADPQSHKNFTYEQEQLRRKGRVVVGNNAALQQQILELFHSSGLGGHSGVHATYQRIASILYWRGLWKAVREFVRNCGICQQYKRENVASPGLLQPLPIPKSIFSDVSMDFIKGLPKSAGKNVMMVVVDRFTKYGHFIALSHPFSVSTIANAYMDHVFKLHGNPTSIVSDRGPTFLSKFWQDLFKLQGVTLHLSSAYHLQSDGQTKVVNRCVEGYLRCVSGQYPQHWSSWLSLAEFWYNTNYQTALELTPFQALYGIPPPIHIPYIPGGSPVAAVDRFLQEKEDMMQVLQYQLRRAQHRMKQMADRHRTDRSFQIGDMVFLKLQPYRQVSIARERVQKFAAKYYGPFRVKDKIGSVAYQLEFPADVQIHDIFHVSRLKKAYGSNWQYNPLPATRETAAKSEPLKILERRMVKRGNQAAAQVLVQWKNSSTVEATWEFASELRKKFPQFSLEDKGSGEGSSCYEEREK